MQRRKFVASGLLAVTSLTAGAKGINASQPPASPKELYELREYEIHFGTNENDLHNYFQQALIPGLGRAGVKHTGAFKELAKSEPVKVYLLIAYNSWDHYSAAAMQLKSDAVYSQASADFMKLSPLKVPYTRYNSKFMIAFDGMPQLKEPAKEPRIFEMRTYEGYNEEAVRRKIKMFNEEEFKIFDRTKLNRVLFGEVIAGKDLPCLTYMLTFKDIQERDSNWGDFGKDPDWKRVSALPEYADTVSRITKIFLEPTAYSQI